MGTDFNTEPESNDSTLLILCIVVAAVILVFVLPRLNFGVSTPMGLKSSSKAIMNNLRSALINYHHDIGKYPHIGEKYSEFNLNSCQDFVLGLTEKSNVLISNSVGDFQKAFPWHGLSKEVYQNRWKGPYLDALPEEFMKDSFGNQIRYVFFDERLWLWSSGVNKKFDELEIINAKEYSGDDIVLSITRRPLNF